MQKKRGGCTGSKPHPKPKPKPNPKPKPDHEKYEVKKSGETPKGPWQ